jgi:hypothetical protein
MTRQAWVVCLGLLATGCAKPPAHAWLHGDAYARSSQLAEHLRGNDVVMFEVDYRHRRLAEAIATRNVAFGTYQVEKMRTAMTLGAVRRPARRASYERFFVQALAPMQQALQEGSDLDGAYARLTAGCAACHADEQVPYIPVGGPVLNR